jgi:WD domain, G-beta repeat
LWNAATGVHLHRLVSTPAIHKTALFTPSGDLLFLGSGPLRSPGGTETPLESGIHVIDPHTGRLQRSFSRFQPKTPFVGIGSLTAYGCSPDGRMFFCGGIDGYVYVFETVTGRIRRELGRHHGWVHAVAATPDSRRLISGSNDLTALVWDISLAGQAPKNTTALTPEEQAKLWAKLLESDAKSSYEAMAALAAQPQIAVALIRQSIKPVSNGPSDQVLDRLVTELGDEKFPVREKAHQELDQFGETAVAGLKARLPAAKSAEVRSRLVRLIDKHNPPTPAPQQIRETRALEILEELNTPEARALMKELAAGVATARLTMDAAASLKRMESTR